MTVIKLIKLKLMARNKYLNSSPIDELGDGACQSGWRFRGEQQALSHKPLAAHTGLHGNSESGHHPPGTVTLTKSVEILTNPILTKSTNEGGTGRGKSGTSKQFAARNKQHLTQQKRTTCAIRESPVCHLDAHDSQTTADQHWLDFNLA